MTDRFDTPRVPWEVTDRYDEARATFDGANAQAQGETIAGRYRIQRGPLPPVTGEAEVYVCLDGQNGRDVAVKLYRPMLSNAGPRQELLALLKGLSSPSVISLLDYGKWGERWFEVMELCQGGSLLGKPPLGESVIRWYLPQIANALRFLHAQGIVHRDLKPGNLLLRDPEGKELVVADFGISSLVENAERGHRTQTQHNTADYLAPEFPSISGKTDYYALGITLIHLLLGKSPFTGKFHVEIRDAHRDGNVPIPANVSGPCQMLLRGLIQVDPGNRWGYGQVMAWLKGEPVVDDLGRPWQPDRLFAREQPFPWYPAAKSPQQLAGALDKFDANKYLFNRQDLRDWALKDLRDPELAGRIEEISEHYTHHKALGLFKLQYVLDPHRPLRVGANEVRTVDELVALLQRDDEATRTSLEAALWGEQIETWIDAVRPLEGSAKLTQEIAALRRRLTQKRRGLGLPALLWLLDPHQPLRLGSGIELRDPSGIDAVIGWPTAEAAFEASIHDQRLEEWLRVRRPDLAQRVAEARTGCGNDSALLVRTVLWICVPQSPFPFCGAAMHDPKQLAGAIDRNEKTRAEGVRLLKDGWIRNWLMATGRLQDPTLFDQAVTAGASNWEHKLEDLLRLLDPTLPPPKIACDAARLDFGDLDQGQMVSRQLVVRNVGRGHLIGSVALTGTPSGIRVDPLRLAGSHNRLKVAIDTTGVALGSRVAATLRVMSNGGALDLPISYRVVVPTRAILSRCFRQGLLFGAGFGIYRLLASATEFFQAAPGARLSALPLDSVQRQIMDGGTSEVDLVSGLVLTSVWVGLLIALLYRLFTAPGR